MAYQPIDDTGPYKYEDCSEGSDGVKEEEGNCHRKAGQRRPLDRIIIYITACTTLIALMVLVATLLGGQKTTECATEDMLKTTYGRNRDYMSLDHKYDEFWKDFSNASDLVVSIPDKSDPDNPIPAAAISMFHQLHCLASIRHALQAAHGGVDIGTDFHNNTHWPHCFDYLRQTILCFADGTIERPQKFEDGTRSLAIDGAYDVRQCRRADGLYEMMKSAAEF